MQEELNKVKKHYKKIKLLFEEKLEIDDFIKLKKTNKNTILKSLLIVKENIILIPLIDKNVKLDEIAARLDLLMKNSN